MQLSSLGRSFIKATERLSLVAYPDGKTADGRQLYSIGYGHNGVDKGATITKRDAERLFDLDVKKYEAAVNSVIARASQQQFDAMVSLAYNVGTEGFKGSTVARRHAAGDIAGAADAFRLWNQSDGSVNPVLVDRREREIHLYLYGDPSPGARPLPLGSPGPLPALVLGASIALFAYFALPRVRIARRVLALA